MVFTGTGFDDEINMEKSSAVVIKHLNGFLDKGHVVITDNYYNSVGIVKRLTDQSTYICGTLWND